MSQFSGIQVQATSRNRPVPIAAPARWCVSAEVGGLNRVVLYVKIGIVSIGHRDVAVHTEQRPGAVTRYLDHVSPAHGVPSASRHSLSAGPKEPTGCACNSETP